MQKNLNSLLKFLFEGMEEAAVSPEIALQSGYALFKNEDAGQINYTLIDAKKTAQELQRIKQNTEIQKTEALKFMNMLFEKFRIKPANKLTDRIMELYKTVSDTLYKVSATDPNREKILVKIKDQIELAREILKPNNLVTTDNDGSPQAVRAIDVMFNNVIGHISFSKIEKDLYKIDFSAAEKGYGPLLYDMAMSTIYPNWLAADRNSVSDDAIRVWNFYFNNRTDVEKELLPYSKELIKGYSELPDATTTQEINKILVDLSVLKKNFDPEKDKLKINKINEKERALHDKVISNPLAYKFRQKKAIPFKEFMNNAENILTHLENEFNIVLSSSEIARTGKNYFIKKYKND